MTDGTISFVEGLGNKAMDSNEMRRKQKGLGVPVIKEPLTMEILPVTGNSLAAMETLPQNPNLSDPQNNFGIHSPNHNQFRATRVQATQFHPVPLDLETPKLNSSGGLNLESPQRGTVPPPSPAEFGEFSPKSLKNQSSSRKLQQVFEAELVREAVERAINLLDNNPGFKHQHGKVDHLTADVVQMLSHHGS
ncbi:uncharacterized protein LOC131311752 [Rhododendron vialii]|uniref:uncharacterized protein LOC131311752 n=1 Tax=Rhododendron vialii TaxID=182163 RepID=UPI0026603925|nr:uncharacterized protein LOC131311752 [Rhododendron vialii]